MVFFEKSQPAPASLAGHLSYREKDVIDRLCSDFKNKCYLCEAKAPTNLNVEHFRPHMGDLSLKFDWNNLYYACGHCNNTKAALERDTAFRERGILDCTCAKERVDEQISYRLGFFPKAKIQLADEGLSSAEDNERVSNTVRLLDAIYNGTGTPIKGREADNLRMQLLKEVESFQDLIMAYQVADESCREDKAKLIKAELKNNSAFTAFKRWIVRDNAELRGRLSNEIQD